MRAADPANGRPRVRDGGARGQGANRRLRLVGLPIIPHDSSSPRRRNRLPVQRPAAIRPRRGGQWPHRDGLRLRGRLVGSTRLKRKYQPQTLRLPRRTLAMLRAYWVTHRHPVWLFPATGRDHRQAALADGPMDKSSVQGAMVPAGPGASRLVLSRPLRHGGTPFQPEHKDFGPPARFCQLGPSAASTAFVR